MSDFDNLTTPPPAPEGEVPQDQRTPAMLAHILGIFTGFIGSLIIWLINKDNQNKSFVIDQAKEALNFQLTLLLAGIALGIIGGILGFIVGLVLGPLAIVVVGLVWLLAIAIGIGNLIFCILAAMKANNGEAYRYPFALRLIK